MRDIHTLHIFYVL